MDRSLNVMRIYGSLILVTLGSGCSHERPPKQATTPTFESTVTESTTSPGGMEPTTPGREPSAPGYPQPGEPAAQGQEPRSFQEGLPGPHGMGQPGMEQPGMGQAPMGSQPSPGSGELGQSGILPASERELCDNLVQVSNLRVEDIPDGLAIVLTPKMGNDLSSVRDKAAQIEQAMAGTAVGTTGGQAVESCTLFDLSRLGGRGVVTEDAKSIRILVTTPDTSAVKNLRKQARDFAKTSGAKKPEAKPQKGQGAEQGTPQTNPPKK